MVQRNAGSSAARQIEFVKNNYFHDAFFLKALGEYSEGAQGTALMSDGVASPEWRV